MTTNSHRNNAGKPVDFLLDSGATAHLHELKHVRAVTVGDNSVVKIYKGGPIYVQTNTDQVLCFRTLFFPNS